MSVPELEAHYKDYYDQEVVWTFAMLGSGHASMWTACCFGQCFVFGGIWISVGSLTSLRITADDI